jgi:DNA-binding ferritin-like protein
MTLVHELVDRVFDVRDEAHREHWNTKSFSVHSALGDFYDGVIDKIDAFIEAYQGQYGLIGKNDDESYEQGAHASIIPCLRDTSDWITANMEALCMNDATLGNLLQDLSHTFLTTLYKLENLK